MASIQSKDAVKAVIAFAAVGAILFSQSGEDVKTCSEKGDCQVITSEEFVDLKADLAGKVERDQPLTVQEWQALIGILNTELEGGKDLGAVSSPEDIKRSLTNLLYE